MKTNNFQRKKRYKITFSLTELKRPNGLATSGHEYGPVHWSKEAATVANN
jgi:hypothetical protein